MSRDAARGDRLLLVEDNPGDADLIIEFLAGLQPPVRITHVETLEQARTAVAAELPDAMLLDLRLPDASGVACVQAFDAVIERVAIVVLTGLDSEALALDCLAAGAQDYIGKLEMRPESLRRAIGYAIARVREKHARHRADALQARLAAIVENSSDAILSCTEEGVLTSWNRGARAMFGFSAEEAIGRPVGEIVRATADQMGNQRRLMELAASGRYHRPEEVARLRKDGTQVILSVLAFPLPDPEGRGKGFGAICRDITEKRARDEALRARNAELAARERQMRALNARLHAVREDERVRISREVHDELGQLLTGLKMDLRWAEKRVEAQEAVVTRLHDAAGLVDRTIATVQRIATELRPSALDTLGLPAAIRDESRRFEDRTGVEVALDVADTAALPAEVATAFFRIFQEMLTNVARHAGATRLCVAFEATAAVWQLRVRDNGAGFAIDGIPEARSLGLLGMHERAAELGGSVEIDTSPGNGTELIVCIPMTAAEQEQQ